MTSNVSPDWHHGRRMIAPGFVVLISVMLAACDSDLSKKVGLPAVGPALGLARQDEPDLPKVSNDASIRILLTSNKQDTAYTVNGVSVGSAKVLRVLVPPSRLVITAQAPCYHALSQRAEADGFGQSSLFEFSFADWDRDRSSRASNCR
jgi:hypothetical protein